MSETLPTNLEVKVKRLRASRSLKLRVYEDASVVVTAPIYATQADIDSFVGQHSGWINQQVAKNEQRRLALTKQKETLFFRGTEYDFRLSVTTQKPGVVVEQQHIIVHTPNEDHQTVRQLLEKWFKVQAQKRFKERVPLLSDLVGKDLMNVTIRSQRSRWGSCSSRNTISLNWRLIMAPDWVSDYVIYHELAHLTHMNHSNQFWQLVADYYPKYRDAEAWLKDHHALLQF